MTMGLFRESPRYWVAIFITRLFGFLVFISKQVGIDAPGGNVSVGNAVDHIRTLDDVSSDKEPGNSRLEGPIYPDASPFVHVHLLSQFFRQVREIHPLS